jgi:hypothetical protein
MLSVEVNELKAGYLKMAIEVHIEFACCGCIVSTELQ